jgi:uncharacterized protein YnzC (UPF0291/DUF896 family)
MKKRRKKKVQLLTPDERAEQAQHHRELLRMIERAQIELATGRRPPA